MGKYPNDYLSQTHAPDGSLKPGVVTSATLATDAVGANALADGSVTTTKLVDGAITTTKLANTTITPNKLDTNADTPSGGDILSYNATTQKFEWVPAPSVSVADGSVTASKLNVPAGGTTGQALVLDTATPGGFKWQTLTTGSATPSGPAGGDLGGTYPNPSIANNTITAAKLAATTPTANGQVLSYDNTTGELKWVESAGGGTIIAYPNNSGTATVVPRPYYIDVRDYGAIGDGVTDDTAAIQAAVDAALNANGMVYAEGTYRINSTLTIRCHADLSRARLNYYGTGVALLIGSSVTSVVTSAKNISTPFISYANKSATGWQTGSVGIKAVNLNTCRITFGEVAGFETGVLVYGDGQGTVHTGFMMGTLRNNKRNLYLDTTAAGWVNSNTFYDGRYMHNPAEGNNVSGARQIAFSAAYDFNNNVFVNPSLEGSVAENMIEIGCGSDNVFINPRFEDATPTVVWGTSSSVAGSNLIIGGYRATSVTATSNAASANRVNTIFATGRFRFQSESIAAAVQASGSSSSNPALEIFDYNDIGGTWRHQFTQGLLKHRAATAFETIRQDAAQGKTYYGSGAAAPAMYWGQVAGSGLGTNSDVYFLTDNTKDIGAASLRPRYVRCGTAVVTGSGTTALRPAAATAGKGAMFFDETLGKPIWVNAAANGWIDATGTAV